MYFFIPVNYDAVCVESCSIGSWFEDVFRNIVFQVAIQPTVMSDLHFRAIKIRT